MLVRSLLLIVAAVGMGGFAPAFYWAATSSLDDVVASHYVRLGNVEGAILDLTSTPVVLDALGGRALIPARQFSPDGSAPLGQEGDANDWWRWTALPAGRGRFLLREYRCSRPGIAPVHGQFRA